MVNMGKAPVRHPVPPAQSLFNLRGVEFDGRREGHCKLMKQFENFMKQHVGLGGGAVTP